MLSDEIKKDYEKKCKEQRKENLRRLRLEIAKMKKPVDFQKAIDFSKNDLSLLESGDKTLSLSHIHAYKTYFHEHHNIDVSVDYLMGYTDVLENKAMSISKDLGLSDKSIKMIRSWNAFKDRKIISTLNKLLNMVEFTIILCHLSEIPALTDEKSELHKKIVEWNEKLIKEQDEKGRAAGEPYNYYSDPENSGGKLRETEYILEHHMFITDKYFRKVINDFAKTEYN